jgi:hypothetical protein
MVNDRIEYDVAVHIRGVNKLSLARTEYTSKDAINRLPAAK